MRDIKIIQIGMRLDTLSPTFIGEFGCQTFVFISKDELKTVLCQYIDNPEEYEKAFYARMETSNAGSSQTNPPSTQGLAYADQAVEGSGGLNRLRR